MVSFVVFVGGWVGCFFCDFFFVIFFFFCGGGGGVS